VGDSGIILRGVEGLGLTRFSRYLEQKQQIAVTEAKNTMETKQFERKQNSFIDIQPMLLFDKTTTHFYIRLKKPVRLKDFAFCLGWIEEELKNYAGEVEEEEKGS